MTPSSQSHSNRKFLWLTISIVLVVSIYTAGWFYAANKLEETVLKVITPNSQQEVGATCDNIEFKGFPFRIGVFCSSVSIVNNTGDKIASFGALRSTATVYNPRKIIWELDSPVKFNAEPALLVSSDWESLQSSFISKGKGIERSSVVIRDLKTNIVNSNDNESVTFTSKNTDIQVRQNVTDLDLAITLTEANITASQLIMDLPTITSIADITLFDRAGLIDGSDRNDFRSTQGELRRFIADIGSNSTFTITGPFAFDEQGLLSAKLTIQIENLEQWSSQIKMALPELSSTIDTGKKLISALNGGGNNAKVDIIIKQGNATLGGLIPIGKIPAI